MIEGFERRLDLAQALIDTLGQVGVGSRIGLLDPCHLGLKRVAGLLFLIAQRGDLAPELAQAVGVAVVEVGRDLDPLPPFGLDRRRLLSQLLRHHHVDEADVLQPAAVVALEQVVHHRPVGLDIGLDADELSALVGRPHRTLGQHSPDRVGLLVVGLGQPLEHLLLPRVVAADRERHQLVERHAVLGVDVEELRRHRRQPQPLLDHRDRDEEHRRDLN